MMQLFSVPPYARRPVQQVARQNAVVQCAPTAPALSAELPVRVQFSVPQRPPAVDRLNCPSAAVVQCARGGPTAVVSESAARIQFRGQLPAPPPPL
jgi:hypothetical protein